jgi:hypothetical protein
MNRGPFPLMYHRKWLDVYQEDFDRLSLTALLLSYLLFDPAEGFGCNAQVGGDHLLRHPQRQAGTFFEELAVSLFGGITDGGIQPALHGHETLVDDLIDQIIQGRYLFAEVVEVLFTDHQYHGVFQRIDVQCGRLARQQAFPVAGPPILHSKMQDMLYTFIVYPVGAYDAGAYKGVVAPGIAFLQQVLVLPQFLVGAYGFNEFKLFFGEGNFTADVLPEDRKHAVKVADWLIS